MTSSGRTKDALKHLQLEVDRCKIGKGKVNPLSDAIHEATVAGVGKDAKTALLLNTAKEALEQLEEVPSFLN